MSYLVNDFVVSNRLRQVESDEHTKRLLVKSTDLYLTPYVFSIDFACHARINGTRPRGGMVERQRWTFWEEIMSTTGSAFQGVTLVFSRACLPISFSCSILVIFPSCRLDKTLVGKIFAAPRECAKRVWLFIATWSEHTDKMSMRMAKF